MTLIALQPTADPLRFQLRVTPQICVGHPDNLFMFGGAGLATGLAAIEAATGRPTVWAAAQYLSYARPGALLDVEVLVPVAGKYTSQGRVIIRSADTEILTVNAALGARPEQPEAQWAQMPVVPAPADCPRMEYDWVRRPDDLNASFEKRVAAGRFGAARDNGACNAARETFLTETKNNVSQLAFGQAIHQLRRAWAGFFHAHIKRAVSAEGKAALRLVQLEGRNAKIHHHAIKRGDAAIAQQ